MIKVLQVFFKGSAAALNLIVDDEWGQKAIQDWYIQPGIILKGNTVDNAPFVIHCENAAAMILLEVPPGTVTPVPGPKRPYFPSRGPVSGN